MMSSQFTEWRKLPISLNELCIATTLRCGQSFRWQKLPESDEWRCVLRGRLISLRQDPSHLYYQSYAPPNSFATPPRSTPSSQFEAAAISKHDSSLLDETRAIITHYLNLTSNLTDLYEQWSDSDPNFKKKAPNFTGIRILRQDAWEALVSFICSSNNNIARISQMVEKLCTNYGDLIATIDERPYHDFPTPEALTGKDVEARLRELGFGYRAKYIYQTALMVANERERGWLDSLRNPESPAFGMAPSPGGIMRPEGREGYRVAHEKLLELQGVGPKVADCVCLMGLGWGESVPVDTHVWQIAQRDYKFGRSGNKSLTKATYDAVGNHFRKLWGKEAGWAHSVLFTADLKNFSGRLASEIDVKVKQEADLPVETVVTSTVATKRPLDEDGTEADTKQELIVQAAETKVTRRRTKRQRR